MTPTIILETTLCIDYDSASGCTKNLLFEHHAKL